MQITPDGKRLPASQSVDIPSIHEKREPSPKTKLNEDDFFDLLTRSQSKRMDDQRCSLKVLNSNPKDNIRKPLTQNNNMNFVQKENR